MAVKKNELQIDVAKIERAIFSTTDNQAEFENIIKVLALNPARDFRRVDLAGIDFGHANLRGFDFSFSNLQGCDFSKAKIHDAKFVNAQLQGAKWPANSEPLRDTDIEKTFVSRLLNPDSLLNTGDRTQIPAQLMIATAHQDFFFLRGIESWMRKCGVEFFGRNSLEEAILDVLSGKNVLGDRNIRLTYTILQQTRPYLALPIRRLNFLRAKPPPKSGRNPGGAPISSRTQIKQLAESPDPITGTAPVPLSAVYLYILATVLRVLDTVDIDLHYNDVWLGFFETVSISPSLLTPKEDTKNYLLSVLKSTVPSNENITIVAAIKLLCEGGSISPNGVRRIHKWITTSGKKRFLPPSLKFTPIAAPGETIGPFKVADWALNDRQRANRIMGAQKSANLDLFED